MALVVMSLHPKKIQRQYFNHNMYILFQIKLKTTLGNFKFETYFKNPMNINNYRKKNVKIWFVEEKIIN